MNKFGFITFILFAWFGNLHSQEDMGNISITARSSFYLNQRWGWDSAYTDRKQNKFFLRNAQLQIRGNAGKHSRFYFGFDIAQIISKGNDPQNPALLDASLQYQGFSFADILLGYDN